MKPMAALAAVSVCSVLALSAGAGAGELQLSDSQLDLVTAGGPLFDSPTGSSFTRLDGPLAPPPPPPAPPEPPAPPAASPTQFVFQDGGVTLRIDVPSNSGGAAPEISAGIFNIPGGVAGAAATRITNDSGGAVVSGGISVSAISAGQ